MYIYVTKKLGTALNCEEMYEKVLLHTVCSLECQFEIVMNNKKAVTILHVRRLLQALTFHIHRQQTTVLVST
jgi:hypothetical protein